MNVMPEIDVELEFDEEILEQGELISDKLNMLRLEQYPPDALKGLRRFSSAEVAEFLGVTQNHIKKLHLEGKGPAPDAETSPRSSCCCPAANRSAAAAFNAASSASV